MEKRFAVHPVGKVAKTGTDTWLEIDSAFSDALLGIDDFSHIVVLYWFHLNDTTEKRKILRVHPRNNRAKPLRGVFATCSPVRPNLIATSICKLLEFSGSRLKVDGIDALADSPIIDIKPYIPSSKLSGPVRTPDWLD